MSTGQLSRMTARPCVSCHTDGSFTYFDHFLDQWMDRMPFVPAHVMDQLPEDERARVSRAVWHRLGARSAPAAARVGAQAQPHDPQGLTGPPQPPSRAGYAVNRRTFLRVSSVNRGAGGVSHV